MTDATRLGGFLLDGFRFGKKATYVPHLHLVWIHPDTPLKAASRRVILEEMSHASVTQFRPSQIYPLRHELQRGLRLRRNSRFLDDLEPLFCQESPIEWFRDIVEALFVAEYPLGMGRPVNCCHLPKSNYQKLGKRIISLAVRMAERADPQMPPESARAKALCALMAFLYQIVPHAPEQGDRILDVIERFGVPNAWKGPTHLFDHLYSQRLGFPAGQKSSIPFSIRWPIDIHCEISEMIKVLALMLLVPVERLKATAPAVLGCLTLGCATFRPVIWLRECRGRIMATIQVWNDPLGVADPMNPLLAISKTRRARGCRCWSFYRDYLKMLKAADDLPYEQPFSRLVLFDALLGCLPRLISKHLVTPWRAADTCPYCRIILQDSETLRALSICLAMIPRKQNDLVLSAIRYPQWLTRECMEAIGRLLDSNGAVVVESVTRPRVAKR